MTRFEQSSQFFQQVNFAPKLLQEHEYMSKEIVDLFKQVLLLWKRSLVNGDDEDLESIKANATPTSDMSDQATIEETFALHLKAQDRKRKLITKIDEVLVLIEKGEYGFCYECGIEIGYDRMIARPTATMCIDCKTASELKERHNNPDLDG